MKHYSISGEKEEEEEDNRVLEWLFLVVLLLALAAWILLPYLGSYVPTQTLTDELCKQYCTDYYNQSGTAVAVYGTQTNSALGIFGWRTDTCLCEYMICANATCEFNQKTIMIKSDTK